MTFLRNVLLTFISGVGMTLIGLFTGVLLARSLGPTGRGLMTTVMVWPAVLVWASGFSLGFANIHFASAEPSMRRHLFANSLWAALVLGLGAGIVAAYVLPIFVRLTPSQHLFLMISLVTLPLGLWSDYAVSLIYGTGRFDRLGLVRVVAPLLTALALLLLWATHSISVATAIVASWMGGWSQIAVTLSFLWRDGYASFRPNWPLFRRSLAYSSRIHIGTLANIANGRLDQLLMTLLVAPKALGLYAFAVTFSEMLRQGTGSISTVLFPRVSAETCDAEKRDIASRAVRWTLLIGSICAVFLGVAAQYFVVIVWGSRFLEAVPTIYVLLPGTVALGVASTMTVSLNGAGKPGTGTVAELASLAVMVPLLWLLLPRMGIFGAGLASTCGYTVNCIVTTLYFARTFGKDSLLDVRPSQRDWADVRSAVRRVR